MAAPQTFDKEFFPTPPAIITKMLGYVSKDAKYFLDIGAGKGAIAEQIRGNERYSRKQVDCIELDPELAAILRDKGFPVVGADWLTYTGVSYYDAVVMNPPFSNGVDHLLKAWDFLHHGEIVCLVNSETITNPYTSARMRLHYLIKDHGTTEDLGPCFRTAERQTGVNVTLVYLKKISEDDTLGLWDTSTQERTPADESKDPQWLAIVDTLGNMEHFYNEATQEMLQAFTHLRRAALYMQANGITGTYKDEYEKIVGLALRNVHDARAEFSRQHRKDSWLQVFQKMEFRKWLDQAQTETFLRDVERESTIPFTKENIKGTLENIYLQRNKLFEQSVANIFDALTKYHADNTCHTEGWKTNDNFKVNRKLIFPWGCRFDHKYSHDFSMLYSRDMDIYNDLDRALCVLDGTDFTECLTIGRAMQAKFYALGTGIHGSFDNTAQSWYFDIRFFKKGTVHLVWRDIKLCEQFNITAAKGKAWLGSDTQHTRC